MSIGYERFMERIKKNGIARSSFYVKFDLNDAAFTRLIARAGPIDQNPFGYLYRKSNWYPSDEGASDNKIFTPEKLRTMGIMCNSVTLPTRELEIIDEVLRPGYNRKVASNMKAPEPVSLKFYCSPDLNERRFIENWMNMVVNPIDLIANYYDEYAKNNIITIFCLPRAFSGTEMDEETALKAENGPIYFVKLYDCFPSKINEFSMSYGDAEKIFEMEVEFSYKYFKTITDLNFPDAVSGIERGWIEKL